MNNGGGSLNLERDLHILNSLWKRKDGGVVDFRSYALTSSLWSSSPLPPHPLSYFSFQPVLHNWCNKDRGMCYPVCGMMYIKVPLLLIEKSSLCGGSGFPLSLSELSFTICPTPYTRKKCVECVVI